MLTCRWWILTAAAASLGCSGNNGSNKDSGQGSGGAGGSWGSGGTGTGGESPSGWGEGTGGALSGPGSPLSVDPIHRGGFCAEDWCWSAPLPQGDSIYEMWSAPGAGVWAIADSLGVLRWSGSAWERLNMPAQGSVSLWGTGAELIYVGLGNTLWRIQHDYISRVALPELDYAITHISGTGPNDVWISTRGALHFDGTSWTRPAGIPASEVLSDVLAVAPDRVWFRYNSPPSLVFWNGVSLETIAESTGFLFATSVDDVWYTSSSAPYRGNENDGFESAGGSSASYLFGTGPDDVYGLYNGTLRHFDGTDWTHRSVGTDQWAGTAHQPGEAWTGGRYGSLYRITEDETEALTPLVEGALTLDLTGVWSDGERTFAVGSGFFELDSSGDTDVWNQLSGPVDPFYPNGIWGSSATDIWLVGPGNQIFHFDGEQVEQVPTGEAGTGAWWNEVHGSGPDDVWAVGRNGLAAHYDGEGWSFHSTGALSELDDVWVAPDGNAWAVGANGVARRYTPGEGWDFAIDAAFSGIQWKSVTGTSSSDVWMAGYHHQMYHFDGTSWENVEGSGYQSGSVEKLWALAPNDIWGVGGSGSIIHYDGTSWRRLDAKLREALLGLWIGPSGEGWAVGRYGTILHRVP